MIQRLITQAVLRDLNWSPIVGLVGPRQVGKTTLARYVQTQILKSSVYLDLELTEDWFKLEDAQSFLKGYENDCVVIDEIQIRPELFALLRALTDQKRVPARFILLGSASPHIVKLNTETLAGRIAYHELAPFSYSEIKPLYSLEEHWIKGGFPGALLPTEPVISRKWMDDFVETFIHRDLARLGFAVSAVMVRNLFSMLAHQHGGQLNASALANSLGVTHPTVNKYLELLEGSFLIRRLSPYFRNVGKRLTKSPKIYIRDSGLLHYMLRIFTIDQLRGNPIIGASWEGYAIEQIMNEAPEFSEFYYYRTSHGAEVDLIVITPSGKMVCIEIKFSVAPNISKGFYQSVEDLQPDFKYVITPAGDRFDRADGLRICPLPVFLEQELPALDERK